MKNLNKMTKTEMLQTLTALGINVIDAEKISKNQLAEMIRKHTENKEESTMKTTEKKAETAEKTEKKAEKTAEKTEKKKAGDFLSEGKALVEKLGYTVKATANDLDNKHRFKVDLGGKNVRFDFSGKTFTVKATVQFTGAEYFEGKAHPYIAKANSDLSYIEEVLASAKASVATIDAEKKAKEDAKKAAAEKAKAEKKAEKKAKKAETAENTETAEK